MPLPNRNQLLLPLIEVLRDQGGSMPANDAIDALTAKLHVDPAVSAATQKCYWPKWGARIRNPWRQTVHWARYDAVCRDWIAQSPKGIWNLTERGFAAALNCAPGIILRVWRNPFGEVVWADARTTAAALEDESVDLLFMSSPYPIMAGRSYGRFSPEELLELLLTCAPHWKRALKSTGNLLLNLKDCQLPGSAGRPGPISDYIYQLALALRNDHGFFQPSPEHIWYNPACGPTGYWTTTAKKLCTHRTEHLLWFSKGAEYYSSTSEVLQPPKPSTIETYLRRARRDQKNRVGPSGQNNVYEASVAAAAAGNPQLVCPDNLRVFANSDTDKKMAAALKDAGLPVNDAPMPVSLAEWYIKFLTREGEHVHDPFLGRGTTALAAVRTGRRFSGGDRNLGFLIGAAMRFAGVEFEPAALAAAG